MLFAIWKIRLLDNFTLVMILFHGTHQTWIGSKDQFFSYMQEKTMMMKMKFHNIDNFSLFYTITIFVNKYKTFYLGPDCLELNIFNFLLYTLTLHVWFLAKKSAESQICPPKMASPEKKVFWSLPMFLLSNRGKFKGWLWA